MSGANIENVSDIQETNGVNVVVYSDEDNFPGFFTTRTAYRAPHYTASLKEIVEILSEHWRLLFKAKPLQDLS